MSKVLKVVLDFSVNTSLIVRLMTDRQTDKLKGMNYYTGMDVACV